MRTELIQRRIVPPLVSSNYDGINSRNVRNYFILRWNFGIRFVYFSDLTFIRTGFADFIYRMSCSLLTMLFEFFWRSNFGWISEDFMISSVLTDELFTKIGPFNTIFPIGPPSQEHSFNSCGGPFGFKNLFHFLFFNGRHTNAVQRSDEFNLPSACSNAWH